MVGQMLTGLSDTAIQSQVGNRKRTSRRSHTNLANLRLAPLSRDISPVDGRVSSSAWPHTSYIEGKSAPTTPSILGRSSSRRQLGGAGLSRKLSIHDAEYDPVQITAQGIPRSGLRPDAGDHIMPKAKSEAALNQRPTRAGLPKLRTPLLHPQSAALAVKPHDKRDDNDWFTRAGLTTTSILRESKGQSWLSSRHSSTSLQLVHSSDEEEEDALASKSAVSLQRLHFADDEFSPETPRATSRWGSRFGSRAASALNSRRGSKVDLDSPELHRDPSDYFGSVALEPDMSVRPDFVDPRDYSDSEDPEKEVARLAREASLGFGPLIDRLVGWTLFDVREDREATDVEAEDETPTIHEKVVHTPVRPISPPRPRQLVTGADRQGDHEEGAWKDAAWLLGVASKVLL
jgi:hypothetical protein